jgi:hypothetical protein
MPLDSETIRYLTQSDAEQLLDEGERTAGLAMLRAVACWNTDSDLELPAVDLARRKLRSAGESW